MSNHVTLSAEIDKRREKALIIDGNNREHVVLPPDLWSDDQQVAIRSAGEADDIVGLAKAVLGDAGYEAFVEDGGTATLLGSLITEHFGALGESSASSRS